jgi:CxxC-x17-CxxC domain-containing protein
MFKKNFSPDKKRFGAGFKDKRDVVMHKAICSNCGKPCEVPFRPMSGKPVYCKECYGVNGSAPSTDRDRGPRKSFDTRAPLSSFSHIPRTVLGEKTEVANNDEMKKQLELFNTKLDKLISLAETALRASAAREAEETAILKKESLKKIVTEVIDKKTKKGE